MSARQTEHALRELARDLEPVRPIPRLRTWAAGAAALWLAGLAAERALGGPPLRGGAVWGDAVFLAVLGGLVLLAAGGLAAALGAAVPGRESTARAGRALAAAGLALALGGGAWAVAAGPGGGAPPASSVGCAMRAAALGLAPALFVCAFLARAWERRPAVGAAAAVAGSAALGALAVHASCSHAGAVHLLLGHCAAPLLAVVALTLPLAVLVRVARKHP